MPIANPPVDVVTIAVFLFLVTLASYFLGQYLAAVFSGKLHWNPMIRLEKALFYFIDTSTDHEDSWQGYARDLLIFNAIGFCILFLVLIIQGILPLNPQHVSGFPLSQALNIAVSFTTNTNWQVYSGETAASYLTQMIGFTVQNFLSAATGLCIAVAVMRGLTRKTTDRIGNFWVDMIRAVLYVLIPLAFIATIVLLSQGVIQNLDPSLTISGYGDAGPQTIAMGPVASQEAIKMLGTNGGGFFNANSAHPYENPTPFTNLFEIILILLIPASLSCSEPFPARESRGSLFTSRCLCSSSQQSGCCIALNSPGIRPLSRRECQVFRWKARSYGSDLLIHFIQCFDNRCGKRAVNTMHDSSLPLGGLVPLFLILVGEVVFGGIGSGFATMIAFVIVAVFIAGLMIGRTSYLAKKIEIFEMKMALITILVPSILVLVFTGIALVVTDGLAGIFNPGPHGLSEVVYAFASMANNNGSAFAGLNAASPFYALTGALVMVVGRFMPAIAMLALAGSLAKKKTIPAGTGTLPTASPSFIIWLVAVILIIGALTFFPFFAMGPIAEHLSLLGGI